MLDQLIIQIQAFLSTSLVLVINIQQLVVIGRQGVSIVLEQALSMLVDLLFSFIPHLILDCSFGTLLAAPHVFVVVGNLHFILIEFVAEVEGADMSIY